MGQTNKNDSDNTVAKELKQRNKNNNRRIKQEYGRFTYNSDRDTKEDLEEFYEWNDDEFEKFSRNGKR
jgi:hypothetical protein